MIVVSTNSCVARIQDNGNDYPCDRRRAPGCMFCAQHDSEGRAALAAEVTAPTGPHGRGFLCPQGERGRGHNWLRSPGNAFTFCVACGVRPVGQDEPAAEVGDGIITVPLCSVEGCEEERWLNGTRLAPYCGGHVCMEDVDCMRRALVNSEWCCSEHHAALRAEQVSTATSEQRSTVSDCAVSWCESRPADGRRYCTRHMCAVHYCNRPTHDLTTEHESCNAHTTYCTHHQPSAPPAPHTFLEISTHGAPPEVDSEAMRQALEAMPVPADGAPQPVEVLPWLGTHCERVLCCQSPVEGFRLCAQHMPQEWEGHPRWCVSGQCRQPSAAGHALCAEHLRQIPPTAQI